MLGFWAVAKRHFWRRDNNAMGRVPCMKTPHHPSEFLATYKRHNGGGMTMHCNWTICPCLRCLHHFARRDPPTTTTTPRYSLGQTCPAATTRIDGGVQNNARVCKSCQPARVIDDWRQWAFLLFKLRLLLLHDRGWRGVDDAGKGQGLVIFPLVPRVECHRGWKPPALSTSIKAGPAGRRV